MCRISSSFPGGIDIHALTKSISIPKHTILVVGGVSFASLMGMLRSFKSLHIVPKLWIHFQPPKDHQYRT